MHKLLLIFFLLVFTSAVFTQDDASRAASLAAPAKWQEYSIPEHGVTFQMPKLPVLNVVEGKECEGQITREYGAYANGTAYVFCLTYKIKPPSSCLVKREYDPDGYRKEISPEGAGASEDIVSANGLKGISIRSEYKITQRFNDPQNNRWFELSVIRADERSLGAKIFFGSIRSEKKTTGIVIGEGSPFVLGDEKAAAVSPPAAPAAEEKKEAIPSLPLMFAMKISPIYTEEARRNQVSGTVRLRIIFSSNGSIGSVIVVSGLPYGLTERAIAAARKSVFIPGQKQGVFVSVSKVVEYNFNLY